MFPARGLALCTGSLRAAIARSNPGLSLALRAVSCLLSKFGFDSLRAQSLVIKAGLHVCSEPRPVGHTVLIFILQI